MTEAGAQPRRRRRWKFLLLAVLAFVPVLAGLGWYITTESFQAMVRRRLVTELERVTGGRVELNSIHTLPLHLQVEVRGLTIHGREAEGEVPYAHVDSLIARVKIISVLGAEFGFDSLTLEHPVLHVIVYPDGTTNQPIPQINGTGKTPVERLFSLSVRHLEVRQGTLVWGDHTIPLDFSAHDVAADMSYSFLARRYESNLFIGKAETKFKDYKPVAWMAEAHLNLGRNAVQIRSLKVTAGHSHVELSGRVENFREPKVDIDYKALVDLFEAATITRQPAVRRGVLQAGGHGTWSRLEFSSTGKLSVTDFDGRRGNVTLSNAQLSTDYEVTSRRLGLSHLEARLLGGSIAGEAEVNNWLSPGKATTAAKRKTDEQGVVRLKFKDLSARDLVAMVSSATRPLNRLNLAGATSGTTEMHWNGRITNNADAQFVADVVPPLKTKPGELPLKAHLRATYRGAGEDLEIAEFSANTPSTEIHASGSLSSAAAVRFSVTTTDLNEWRPFLGALTHGNQIPVNLRGQASFSGTASGRLSDVMLAGSLRAEDFNLLAPATSRAPERWVHWDNLATFLQVSNHEIAARNGLLQHGEASIRFDASAQLQKGQFLDQSPFTIHLDMRNADFGEAMALAGYNYPVSGTGDVRVRASGTRANPHGEGHVELTHVGAYGQKADRFSSDLRFVQDEVELNNIRMAYGQAQVTGGGTYNLSSGSLRFNLSGRDFELSQMAALQGQRTSVEGRLDFAAQGAGTRDEPVIQARVHVRDLTFDHERAGDFLIDAETHGHDLHLTGRSQFGQADLQVDGDVHLTGDWPADLNLKFTRLDIDAALRAYLQGKVTGHSATGGTLQIKGPLRHPGDLSLTGSLNDLHVDVENIKLDNSGPVKFSVADHVLRLEQFHLVGERTDLTAVGTVQLTGDRALQMQAQGRMNLRLIESFNRDFTSSGVVTAKVDVSGTVAQPLVQGRMEIARGSIAYIDLPSALSDINGSIVFNQSRAQIESLTAHTGGGSVALTGYATITNGQMHFDLGVQGQDVRLRYPPGVSSTANVDLHYVGTPAASTLSGDVTVTKLSLTPGFDFGAYLQRSAQAGALPQTNPLLNRIRLDLHIVTTPELQMQTASLRLSGDADLRLRGTAGKPVLLGRADILEGEVYFNGTKYHLERGDVSFLNPSGIKPVVDLQATTRVRDYDITLRVSGEPDKLNVTYRSEPPLPSADIVALLALGRTREESAQLQQSGQGAFSQEASSAILTEALNATVSSRVQKLFGGSRIKIDPEGLTTETSTLARGPAVTIEQQVAGNLTLTYSTNISQASQQIIQVEYSVSRNVSIVAIRDQNGVVSFDVRIRRRKK